MSTINQSKLDELITHIKTLHPQTVIVLKNKNTHITLDVIMIHKTQKNMGVGTNVMQQLIHTADINNWEITLTPDDCFGANKQRLEMFYRRFGFIRNTQSGATETMIRPKNRIITQ